MVQKFRPGEIVPQSGIYTITHDPAHVDIPHEPAQEQAIRLSPRDPNIALWYFRIGQVHQIESRTDEAILWFEKARIANMQLPFPHAHLAAAYALKGELERAAAELAEARKLGARPSNSDDERMMHSTGKIVGLHLLDAPFSNKISKLQLADYYSDGLLGACPS
jgi:hypothetical protein